MGNSNEIELSVIVPVYNVEKYLERCLNSILNQSYQVGEIICVNDGSTDNSLDILKEIAQKDNRIKIINKKNGGLVSARKAGSAIARGRYITHVDSDDWIERDMYKDMIAEIKFTGADVVTSGCIRDYDEYLIEDGESIQKGVYEGDDLINRFQSRMISTDRIYEPNMSVRITNKIFRKDLYMKYQCLVSDDTAVGEDLAFVFPCVLNSSKIAVTGKNYYHYCIRNDSMLGEYRENEDKELSTLFEFLYIQFSKKKTVIPNIMEQYSFIKYYNLLLRCKDEIFKFENGELSPFGSISNYDKLVIYGAGKMGVRLKKWLECNPICEVVAWVDKANGKASEPLDFLFSGEYDKIIVAVALYSVASQIKEELIQKGIREDIIYTIDANMLKQREDFTCR
jgi:glycosyltransferase involved in cell wall biosynthesis